jgi:TonB-dependent SusC/RagA subfamily outer membrane receptor
MNDFVVKAKQRAKYEEDIWTIQLNEVEVTAPRIKRDEARLQFWANKSSDATITRAVMEQFSHTYVTDYLLHTSGVMVYPNGAISIRGSKGLPLVFIDGVEQYWPENGMYSIAQSPLERVSISAIESIDVFKGFGKTVFGMRGANGVISITTKRGENTPYTEKTNSVVYAPLGYQKPANFYSPKYETLEEKQSNLPDYRTTIFWKPDVVISDNGKESFEFYSSDYSTTYSVVIEGLTNDGKIVRRVEKIVVGD